MSVFWYFLFCTSTNPRFLCTTENPRFFCSAKIIVFCTTEIYFDSILKHFGGYFEDLGWYFKSILEDFGRLAVELKLRPELCSTPRPPTGPAPIPTIYPPHLAPRAPALGLCTLRLAEIRYRFQHWVLMYGRRWWDIAGETLVRHPAFSGILNEKIKISKYLPTDAKWRPDIPSLPWAPATPHYGWVLWVPRVTASAVESNPSFLFFRERQSNRAISRVATAPGEFNRNHNLYNS